MMNDRAEQAAVQAATLDDYLSRWHHWASPKTLNGTDHIADPAFREAQTYRGWDPEDEVMDRDWFKFAMNTIDFIVTGDRNGQGGFESPYKDAILINARNCATGFSVWVSPRLPRDSAKRVEIVAEARRMLLQKMRAAGIPI